tara:strand:- start:663 stop:1160 length:498 start_codon:yes stop_codon:yes gene_type:complete
MDFDSMSIKDLRTYAKEHGIKLQSATKKADILDIVKTNAQAGIEEDYDELLASAENEGQAVMTSPNEERRQQKEDDIIAERLMKQEVDDQKPKANDLSVCLYSEKKYSSTHLGKLDIGYNIVKKDLAKIWIRLPDVRLADKEELARAQAAGVKPGQRVGKKGRRM